MISFSPHDPYFDAVQILWLGSKDNEPIVDIVRHQNSAVKLRFVVGDGRDVGHLRMAADIAQTRNDSELLLAVMACIDAEDERRALKALTDRFDSVVVAAPNDVHETVASLSRAILIPVSGFHHWCYDWNDMRRTCQTEARGEPARVFTIRARGEAAVSDVIAEWLNIGPQVWSAPEKALVVTTVASYEQASLHVTLLKQLGEATLNADQVGSGLAFDDSFATDELAVTIATFGHAMPRPVRDRRWAQPDNCFDIPAFLLEAKG